MVECCVVVHRQSVLERKSLHTEEKNVDLFRVQRSNREIKSALTKLFTKSPLISEHWKPFFLSGLSTTLCLLDTSMGLISRFPPARCEFRENCLLKVSLRLNQLLLEPSASARHRAKTTQISNPPTPLLL